MELQELLMTALRAVAVYVLMLVVIRLLGKRTVGNFTAFDLLVALMLGEVVDEMIYGDVTMLQGSVVIVVLGLCKSATSWLAYWDHGLDAVLEGTPTVIVRDGDMVPAGMKNERMNEKEVMSHLREQGIDDIREVKLAVVEQDGKVSVIKRDWAEPIQKADLGGEMAKQKGEDTKGQEEPPRGSRTDSPEALGHEEG
jgi:uncharacterized membrane protein YcaP (DUF421 family)